MADELIAVTRDDRGLAVVEMRYEKTGNAMSAGFVAELLACLHDATAPEVKAVVLLGRKSRYAARS